VVPVPWRVPGRGGGATPAGSGPLDFFAERPSPKDGRGEGRNFEPQPAVVAPFLSVFINNPEPYLIKVAEILRKCS